VCSGYGTGVGSALVGSWDVGGLTRRSYPSCSLKAVFMTSRLTAAAGHASVSWLSGDEGPSAAACMRCQWSSAASTTSANEARSSANAAAENFDRELWAESFGRGVPRPSGRG